MTAPTIEVNAPGVYDMDAEQYHAHPSLSASGARKLLPPSCPALYRYEADHPPAPKREFDIGHAAHRLVLGAGPELAVIDAADYKTTAARQKRDEAHARGAVPLLSHEHDQVQAMAAALRAHPLATALFQPGRGQPERSLFWLDIASGVWCRARLDWLPERGTRRMILPEYKSCRSAAPDNLQRAIHDYGYHQQAAWYIDGVTALGLAAEPAFVLVAQEKTPPYLVTIAEPDAVALRIGRQLNRQAINTYRECTATGSWPGYSDGVEHIGLPAWVERRHLEDM